MPPSWCIMNLDAFFSGRSVVGAFDQSWSPFGSRGEETRSRRRIGAASVHGELLDWSLGQNEKHCAMSSLAEPNEQTLQALTAPVIAGLRLT